MAAGQVTGLEQGRGALVLVVHHAVSDGVGGLAVLSRLVDSPAHEPTTGAVASGVGKSPRSRESLRRRILALPSLRSPGPGAPRPRVTSLNQPITDRRRLAAVRLPLATLTAAAHREHVTINDLLVTAAADALGSTMTEAGEPVERLVISVPVSFRRSTTATALGNQVGVMLVSVSCSGSLADRLHTTAAQTRVRRSGGRTMAWVGPLFRWLTRLGLVHLYIRRQRRVSSFLTNLHGPGETLSLLGVPVTGVVPISLLAGNVTVAFAACSYAGTLCVTVVADAGRWADAQPLAAAFERALRELVGPPGGAAA